MASECIEGRFGIGSLKRLSMTSHARRRAHHADGGGYVFVDGTQARKKMKKKQKKSET
jgi:hypothetical protein